jgi:hypothetical protein
MEKALKSERISLMLSINYESLTFFLDKMIRLCKCPFVKVLYLLSEASKPGDGVTVAKKQPRKSVEKGFSR